MDFSAIAIQHASDRAARFGLAERACFVVGDLAATGLPEASADAVVPIDALHMAADPRRRAARSGASCDPAVDWCSPVGGLPSPLGWTLRCSRLAHGTS